MISPSTPQSSRRRIADGALTVHGTTRRPAAFARRINVRVSVAIDGHHMRPPCAATRSGARAASAASVSQASGRSGAARCRWRNARQSKLSSTASAAAARTAAATASASAAGSAAGLSSTRRRGRGRSATTSSRRGMRAPSIGVWCGKRRAVRLPGAARPTSYAASAANCISAIDGPGLASHVPPRVRVVSGLRSGSWWTTTTPSAVSRTSNSIASTPIAQAPAMPARVFSGNRPRAPRWPMICTQPPPLNRGRTSGRVSGRRPAC